MTTTRDTTARRWIATGAWAGIALALARCGLVLAMDRWGRGLDATASMRRAAERMPWVLPWAIVTGLLCAWMLSRGGKRHARHAIAAMAIFAVLSGWPLDDAYHVPGFATARGAATSSVFALVAAGSAAIVGRLARSSGAIGGTISVAGAAFLAIALPIAARAIVGGPGETMVVREVVRQIAFEESAWSVETHRADAPPHAGSITPALDVRLDVGEMPALVMPPPCRVSFTVGADEVGLRLRAAAGCDVSVARAFADGAAAPRIVFRVDVDGRRVLEHRRTPHALEGDAARAWSRLGGEPGIEVAPGSRVTLETAFEGDAPSAEVATAARDVGFGGLELERAYERPRERASPDRPNVVLVVMDTLRADRTSAHGYARATTPVLDELARRGTLYERAYSTSSWTWPSTASILTGLDPAAHGVVSEAECHVSEDLETLPEALQRAGWTTAAFACNPLVSPTRNFDAGFETFAHSGDRFVMSPQVMSDVTAWLEAHASTRFFLYLHLVEPHELHRSRVEDRARFAGPMPSDLDEHALHAYAQRLLANEPRADVVSDAHLRWLSDAYDAAVASGDHALSEVLAKLDEIGLRDDTVVVFTSDHGEELLEHGHLQHGQSVHTELVHVPLVIAGPGFAAGARVATPVSNRHLAPTLALVGGVRLALDDAIDLRTDPRAEALYLATDSGWWNGARDVPVRALRDGGWSAHGRLGESSGWRLYDLRADPGELVDVASAHPDRTESMRRAIEEHERALSARRPRAVRAGTGTREMLRATGYAGDER